MLTFFLADFVVIIVLYLYSHLFALLVLLYLCVVFFYDVYFVFSVFPPLSSHYFMQWVIYKLLLLLYGRGKS